MFHGKISMDEVKNMNHFIKGVEAAMLEN